MSSTATIICKPTPWFMLRALMVFLMFGFFAAWFYLDGTTGYRKKNYEFYLHATFEKATSAFSKMQSEAGLTPAAWRDYVARQTVDFPEDSSVLPADTELPMPWPEILWDYDKVKSLQHNHLWTEYSGKHEHSLKPVEQPYDAEKIEEQIRVMVICLGIAAFALFFLIRTFRRSMAADAENLKTPDGKTIPFSAMRVLDLRKWEGKGIAFIEYEAPKGMKRTRIDGLTYGGFSQEKGQPAESLMNHIRKHFTGEIIDYGEEKPQEAGSMRA